MAALDLRPLSLGELLDRTFFLYRRNFLLFIGIAAIPYLFVLAIVFFPGLFFYGLPGRAAVSSSAQIAGMIVGGILLFASAIAVFVAFLYSAGASVMAVSEIYAGRITTIRGAFRMVRGKAGAIFGVMVLSGLILMGGLLALVIPGLYLLCRIPVATAATLVEDVGPAEAIRRSFDLTRGFAGRASLIYLLAAALTYGVGLLFQIPWFILMAMSGGQSHLTILWTILGQVGNVLGGVLIAPVNAIAFTLFYYDLRVRKEAFDLQMMMQAIGPDPMPPPITGGVPSAFGRDAT